MPKEIIHPSSDVLLSERVTGVLSDSELAARAKELNTAIGVGLYCTSVPDCLRKILLQIDLTAKDIGLFTATLKKDSYEDTDDELLLCSLS